MTSHELEIYVNDVISYFCQQLRIGWVLCPESLKLITPKVFPKQDCFHRYYWKSMSLHQEKQLPDKGKSVVCKACLHRSRILLLYNVTKLRAGDLTDTWRRWTVSSEASNFVPCPQICNSICKIQTCVIPHLHECVGFCSTRCSQEDFTEEMENAACWTHREWIFQLALFSKSTKNFHQIQNNAPISRQQGPYKYWK